jgi:hypothetical protein
MPPHLGPKLFLAYSPEDQELVEEFTLVLAGTVRLDLSDVLSTTRVESDVPGEKVASELVRSALAAEVMLAFVSESSLRAPSVMFELGARWAMAQADREPGSQRTLLVLLGGLGASRLPHALKEASRLEVTELGDWERLLSELGGVFGEKEASLGRLVPEEKARRLARIVELARPSASASRSDRAGEGGKRRILGYSGVALIGLVVLGWSLIRGRAEPAPAKYDFEQGAQGWNLGGACLEATPSNDQAKQGKRALKLTMALSASHPRRQAGEAFVEVHKHPPPGVPAAPVNLAGRSLTAWVYAPNNAAGDRRKPNGSQLLAKDASWRTAYGPWQNVAPRGWLRLRLEFGASHAGTGFVAPGFDPTQIIAVGVKFSLGGDANATYEGPVYVDAIDW